MLRAAEPDLVADLADGCWYWFAGLAVDGWYGLTPGTSPPVEVLITAAPLAWMKFGSGSGVNLPAK